MISLEEGPVKLLVTGERREIKAVAQKLRYRPSGYYYSPRFAAYKQTDGEEGWDGYVSVLTPNKDDDTMAMCLRGHKDAVINCARDLGFSVSTRECLKSPFSEVTSDDIPEDLVAGDFHLDEYQRESVAYWLRHGMGVNKIAINGGKTAMFAAVAEMINRQYEEDGRVLYITQTERLVNQSYKDIRKFLPHRHITQFGGGGKDRTGKHMVISTVAMLWRHRHQLLKEEWFSSFIALLYDESHHVSSSTSSKLLHALPCFFRLGASDTRRVNSPDDMTRIRGLLGPIRYAVPVSTYIQIGRSAKPTIYIVDNPAWNKKFDDVPYTAQPDTPAWALVGNEWKKGTYVGPVYELDDKGNLKTVTKKVLGDEPNIGEQVMPSGRTRLVKTADWQEVEVPVTIPGYHTLRLEGEEDDCEVESTYCLLERVNDVALVRFKERNAIATAWAKYYSQVRKFPTLVVCTRTLHIYILESLIKQAIGADAVQILIGNHTTRQRNEAFDWFRHTPGGVLISPLVQEGVSINEIRGGVIADHITDWERANQIIGRFIRKKQHDNEAHITFIYDNQHSTLESGSKEVLFKLMDIRGYSFAHPLLGPETLKEAKFYKTDD